MTHVPALITDLALILISAAIITLVFKKLKQPLVLGYIIAGMLVGPNFNLFPTVGDPVNIKTWAEIGVIILLFSLGLEFSFKKLLKVGSTAVLTALSGVVFTLVSGFTLGYLLDMDLINSLFFGGILAIASTTIIIRAYDEMGLKTSKFAQIVLGSLVIEDLVAVVLMVLLSSVAVSRSFEGVEMLYSILKLVFFLILWFTSGIYFLPTILRKLKGLLNEESLLILSLALCFLMVYLASNVGFSPALGAFVMGSILSETTKAEKIEHLVLPLKNLFGAIFFVSVGMLLDFDMIAEYYLEILLATALLLVGKPTFVTIGALISGQNLKTSLQAGMSLSQIGEFSFIIAGLGTSLNVTDSKLYPIAVAVSVLTTFTTPYMIRYSVPMHLWLQKVLPETWLKTLEKYSIGARKAGTASSFQSLMRAYLVNVLIYSVFIISIILINTLYIMPLVEESKWGLWLNTGLMILVLAPFLWALAFRRTNRELYAKVWQVPTQRGPLIILMLFRVLLAIAFIGFLFDRLFSPLTAFFGVLVSLVFLIALAGKIKKVYGKIENRFLMNLNERESQAYEKNLLAPWDTHISNISLGQGSAYIGKTLEETMMREQFGVNVAKIERGNQIINVPDKEMRLYPNDVLFVIGSDEQLKSFSEAAADTFVLPIDGEDGSVELHGFTISEDSPLVGQSIRGSKIRVLSKGLVVGVERDGERILNPDSGLIFQANDKIWIVGNAKRINVISRQNEQ